MVVVRDRARHAADDLLALDDLLVVGRWLVRLDLEHGQPPVGMAAVMKTRDRLLAWVAPFREADRPLDEARLGRKDALVYLTPEAGSSGGDPHPLEFLVVERRLERLVQDLDRGHAVVLVRDAVALAEHDRRGVLFELDLALRCKT